jgi:hypothetical protein
MARREHQRRASAVHWWVGTVCFYVCMCRRGGLLLPCKSNAPILATFDTTPSPHGRINDPSLLLAFAHIHGEAGTPTEGIGSALVGRNGLFLCIYVQKWWIITSMQIKRPHPFSLHLTPPRLRTGESMILVCFWPSPISVASCCCCHYPRW